MISDFSPADIEQRIHAAIRPQLDRADRLIWEIQNQRSMPGRHTHEWPLALALIEAQNIIAGKWAVIRHTAHSPLRRIVTTLDSLPVHDPSRMHHDPSQM